MTMYFGKSWCAMTDEGHNIPTPTESKCCGCNEGFVEGDAGMAIPTGFIEGAEPPPSALAYYHKNCFLRTIFGSVGHQRKQCSCFGGTLEDPQGLTPREAADAAVREYKKSTGRTT